jgi:ubiquinone/menaquinone biosynthesis C-methylase UbiE
MRMSERDYTPPLGNGETADYDRAIRRWTRERRWRGAMLSSLAPLAGETILDIGCGTGTFAIMVKRQNPLARVIGIDPDKEALSIASEKALAARVEIEWMRGFAWDAPVDAVDAVVSSLVFHQTPLEEKRTGLSAMYAALRPSGRLLLVDYLRQKGLMRQLFRLTIQQLDGIADTQPNADGVMPGLVREAGFADVQEPWSIPTVTGTIGMITATRAM